MTKIKICGISRPEDIEYVNEARPDYIGFVFAESKRRVSEAQALALRKALHAGIIPVGVFVNAPADEIAALYEKGVIEAAQLHGAETESDIEALRTRARIPIIKAFSIAEEADFLRASASPADYLLLDHGPGGTGAAFDWNLLRRQRGRPEKPWFLAGGINEKNIQQALEKNPYAVDISSGAETNGIKDRNKIEQLVKAAQEHSG
ncbi:MAG: phosphoribosylanthranilate isomerase [Clostridiales Family XIII bacterium]|nr:phosphoribosylanthranilate isomerase [Clostridiales Family XIII bacterium]